MTTFTVTPISSNRLLVKFSSVMTDDLNLVLPLNYDIKDVAAFAYLVSSVKKQAPSDPNSVVLLLSEPMESGFFYNVQIDPSITDIGSSSVTPNTFGFTWVAPTNEFSVPLTNFQLASPSSQTGVDGLALTKGVYFSPSLVGSNPNSIIKVDEVDVCTTAYDTYNFPAFKDPPVLSTFSRGALTTTLGTASLWGIWSRMEETRRDLTHSVSEDPFPTTTTPKVEATVQYLDLNRIALLNNPSWTLFDNVAAPPYDFILAGNLSPIPPGPAITTLLVPGHQTTVTLTDWVSNTESFTGEIPAFDPTPRNLTVWQQTSVPGGSPAGLTYGNPWVGTTSAGTSGARNFHQDDTIGDGTGTLTPVPTEVTTIDGHAPLLFNGTNQVLSGSTAGNHFNVGAKTGISSILIRPLSANVWHPDANDWGSGGSLQNSAIWSDSSYFGLFMADAGGGLCRMTFAVGSGLQLPPDGGHYDYYYQINNIYVLIPFGQWSAVFAQIDGTTATLKASGLTATASFASFGAVNIGDGTEFISGNPHGSPGQSHGHFELLNMMGSGRGSSLLAYTHAEYLSYLRGQFPSMVLT